MRRAPGWKHMLRNTVYRGIGRCDSVGDDIRLRGTPSVENAGEIVLGSHVSIHSLPIATHFLALPGGRIRIGDGVCFAHGCEVSAAELVQIGDRTRLGAFVLVMDSDFHVPGNRHAKPPVAPVFIDSDVQIGNNVIILKGARIGRGAWIATGSSVSGDVPAGTRVQGVFRGSAKFSK